MRFLHLAILISLLSMNVAHARQSGRARVLKIDAVELIDQQREVEGKVEFQYQHGRYTYLFSNDANRKAFEANPAKYEIQQGGACARMGPLSGEGSTKLFEVHDGRLYIFASEQCKRAFIAGPDKFLESSEPKPEVTEESQRRGRVTIDMIVAHSGMLRRAGPIMTVRERLARDEESGGKTYAVTTTLTLMLPDGVREETCWNEACWSNVVRGESAWSIDSTGSQSLVEVQRQALLHDAGRHPWMLISQRDQPGFIATHVEDLRGLTFGEERNIDCSVVLVHWQGANTTLTVDGAGRVRMMKYRGRGPDATIGEIEKAFSEFHDVGGYEMPGRVQVSFSGTVVPSLSGALSEQAVNDPADKARFERPEEPTR